MSFTGRRIQLNLSIAFSRDRPKGREALLIVTSSYSIRLRRSLLRGNVTTSGVLLARGAIARGDLRRDTQHPSPPSSLLPATSPRRSISLLHPALRTRDARIDPTTEERREKMHSTATLDVGVDVSSAAAVRALSSSPIPRDENFSKREFGRGPATTNLTVSHQLVAPFNCIHYGGCHLSSSSRDAFHV